MAYMHHTNRSSHEGNDAESPSHPLPESYSYYNHATSDMGSRSHHYADTSPSARTPPSFRVDALPRGPSRAGYDQSLYYSRTGTQGTATGNSYSNLFEDTQPLRSQQGSSFPQQNIVSPSRGTNYEYNHSPFGNVPQVYNPYESGQQHNAGSAYGSPSPTASVPSQNLQTVFARPRNAPISGLDSRPRAPQYPVSSSHRRHGSSTDRLQVATSYPQPNHTYLSPSTPSGRYAPLANSPSRSPPESPTISVTILNANAPGGHSIREIPITERDRAKYIRPPTAAESASGWRHGYLKCIFEGCQSPIEPNKVATHLALHIHAKKAHECICGARFGRLSEANRHIEDQSPCQQCRESRRKHKGTRICARCIGSTPRLSE